ncbi:hypothetical protein JL722_12669 [Aureococcus anophagefferens]|nr:hypothetical protein JL722_12669 [Aureococcus anophagefferens]
MGNASSLSPERIALVQGALGYLAFGSAAATASSRAPRSTAGRGAWRRCAASSAARAAGAAAAAADRPPPEVTVPLHQRVALLRRRGLSAADAKAKAVAMKKGGLRDDLRPRRRGVHALAPYVGAKTYDFDRVLGAAAT